jgi:hypothetical protein
MDPVVSRILSLPDREKAVIFQAWKSLLVLALIFIWVVWRITSTHYASYYQGIISTDQATIRFLKLKLNGTEGQVSQYAMVKKDGTISKEKNFGEYGLEVTKILFQGYPAYHLKFDKVPKPLDVKTLAKATAEVTEIESKPNERRVRFIDAGFGGTIVECDFVVWAFE